MNEEMMMSSSKAFVRADRGSFPHSLSVRAIAPYGSSCSRWLAAMSRSGDAGQELPTQWTEQMDIVITTGHHRLICKRTQIFSSALIQMQKKMWLCKACRPGCI